MHPSGIAHPVNHHQPGKLKLWEGGVSGSTGQGWVAGPQLRSPLLKTLRPRSWNSAGHFPPSPDFRLTAGQEGQGAASQTCLFCCGLGMESAGLHGREGA